MTTLSLAAQLPLTLLACAPDRLRGDAVPSDAQDSLAIAMAAAQKGDADSYRWLLRHCVPVIASEARSRGFRDAAVDDIVQDTLLTVHRVRHTYDPGLPFLPWLRAIARRRTIDALRQHIRRRSAEVQDEDRYVAYPDQAETAEESLEWQDRRRQLASAMAALPEAQRQAVEQLSGGQSLEQAAAATGRSKGALKVNFHRAIKALRLRHRQDREDGA